MYHRGLTSKKSKKTTINAEKGAKTKNKNNHTKQHNQLTNME